MSGKPSFQSETRPLLEGVSDSQVKDSASEFQRSAQTNSETTNSISVLPIAFLAAFGMAATAATSIFAYASLLCKNPTHCQKSEQTKYAGSVALAVSIANVCGLLVLGPFEKLTRAHRKTGLALWIICRSLSVVALALGIYFSSIVVALSGRVFEGLASDNLLHFNLNTIYVQTPNKAFVSRLIGASLALFMIGISISPALAGLFQNFVTSFFMALGIFSFSILYLAVFVGKTPIAVNKPRVLEESASCNSAQESFVGKIRRQWSSLTRILVSPMLPFYERPISLLSGVSLLIHNAVQSYIFSLIMVHTTVVFGFSSKQNGQLLSIVHAVSAAYLSMVLFIIPGISRRIKQRNQLLDRLEDPEKHFGNDDALLALLSLVVQVLALLGFANAAKVWEIYLISAFSALGLATPSFMKSHFLGYFQTRKASQAVGALTMMETLGALMSPLLLGAWQALWPGVGVFYGAAGMMSFSTVLFMAAILAQSRCRCLV